MALGQTILITGATGQVGGELARLLPDARTPGRAEIDLSDPASIRAWLRQHRPRWIINPAAYTAVDKAEQDSAAAFAINCEAPRVLGEEARELGATVIHFSTDYVFDGSKPSPYVEIDPVNPLSVYGASKLAGEQALAATGARHLILRTSWVYAATGRNFLLTILRLARERAEMKIVDDQHGAPTAASDLAALTAQIIASGSTPPSGIYHATGFGETTWHGFASEIVRQAQQLQPGVRFASLLPVPTAEYPTPARRPANSRLDCGLLAGFGYALPPWQQSLAAVMQQLHTR